MTQLDLVKKVQEIISFHFVDIWRPLNQVPHRLNLGMELTLHLFMHTDSMASLQILLGLRLVEPRGVWSRNCNPSSLDVSCGNPRFVSHVWRFQPWCYQKMMVEPMLIWETHIQSNPYFDGLTDFLQFTQLNLLWYHSSSWICHLQTASTKGFCIEIQPRCKVLRSMITSCSGLGRPERLATEWNGTGEQRPKANTLLTFTDASKSGFICIFWNTHKFIKLKRVRHANYG